MTAYTIHQPLISASDPLDQADQLRFIKEGFAWYAFFFPILWLFFHRMWLVLVIYLAVVVGFELVFAVLGVGEVVLGLIAVAFGFVFAAEANNLHRWTLGRSGFRMIAAISGRNLETCELKFFSAWSPETLTGAASEQGIPGTLAATSELGRSYYSTRSSPSRGGGLSIFGSSRT
ncbi:MAG: DUF2628 domain-containing protein [Methyloligellaceae bacterium]